MGNQAGIIIRNVKNELYHSAKRLILNEVKGIECLRRTIKGLRHIVRDGTAWGGVGYCLGWRGAGDKGLIVNE